MRDKFEFPIFSCVGILVTALITLPAQAEEFALTSEGTVEFLDNGGNPVSDVVDRSVPDQLRDHIRLYWDTPRVPWSRVAVGNENGVAVTPPSDEEDWNRLDLKLKLFATQDRIELSTGIRVDVYIDSEVTEFWGEQTINVDKFDASWKAKTRPFTLKLYETNLDTTFAKLRSLSSGNAQLSSWAQPMQESIRLFKIVDRKDHRDIVAAILSRYLRSGEALDPVVAGFLQEEFTRHPHYTRTSPSEKAKQLHQLALKLYDPEEQATIAGTNAVSRNQIALTLLHKLPLADVITPANGEKLAKGTPLPASFQDAIALKVQIICNTDSYECFDEMQHYANVDRDHPFDGSLLWLMIDAYLRALVDIYKDSNAPTTDADFIRYLQGDDLAVKDWTLAKCLMNRRGGTRSDDMNRRIRQRPIEKTWLDGVSKGQPCNTQI